MNATLEAIYIKAAGSSEGSRKGWEHRQRWQASAALKELRKSGFKGRVSIEHDKRNGVYFLRKQEGELAAKKPATEITPYDKEIRRMKKFGTTDLHGALADAIYDDQQAREEYEGDFENPEDADWGSASADLAANYLAMHRLPHQIKSSERIVVEVIKASSLDAIYAKAQRQGACVKAGAPMGNKNAAGKHQVDYGRFEVRKEAHPTSPKFHVVDVDSGETVHTTHDRKEADAKAKEHAESTPAKSGGMSVEDSKAYLAERARLGAFGKTWDEIEKAQGGRLNRNVK